jgi:hypothetical protein
MHSQAHRSHGTPVHAGRFWSRFVRRLPRWIVEAVPGIVLAAALLFPYLDYPLLWDGGWYYECLKTAMHSEFAFKNFLCFQHPTFLFIGIFTVPEYFLPNSVWAIHAVILAWHLLSVAAFSAICRKLLPHVRPLTRILATALFATQPVILANATALNPDTAVTYSFVILLALLMYGRHTLAIATGILMTFSKETGILFYMLATAGHWIFAVRPHHISTVRALRASWWRVPYLLPAVLFVIYSASGIAFFEGHDSGDLVRTMTSFDLLHPRFHLMLKEIFVFQFTWIQTAIILVAGLLWLWRWDKGLHPHITQHTRLVWLFALLYAAGTYFITRYDHFNNVRYFMVIFPLGTALFAVSASSLFRHHRPREILLSFAILLQVTALFLSVDPISQRLFGTFPVGKLVMYPLGNFDGCCAYGRDQLVYNFQHLKLIALQDNIFRHIRPAQGTIIGNHPLSWFGFNEGFDLATYRRDSGPSPVMPLYLNAHDLTTMQDPPESFWYIEYPHMADQAEQLLALQERFTQTETVMISEGGYTIPLHRYVLREDR